MNEQIEHYQIQIQELTNKNDSLITNNKSTLTNQKILIPINSIIPIDSLSTNKKDSLLQTGLYRLLP